jgi:glycosyltransferase involved in cell wall biosynthesis
VRGRPLAVVVQRYGREITGGSETLARAVAERLAPEFAVTVFTTCARDYVTWRNELPPGKEEHGGVTILRFESEEERDLHAFNAYAEILYARGRRTTEDEELSFLRRQGPFVPGLTEALERAKGSFEAILFFTYLYYPTYEGLARAPERSILVPTAHDEPPLRFGIFDRMFAIPRAFAFCSSPEEALVRQRFSLGGVPSAVTGIGVEGQSRGDVSEFRRRHSLEDPYLLYAGRIDAGKGCAAMLQFYRAYRKRRPRGPDLVLIGTLAMELPDEPGVRYLGFVSEDEKSAALSGAEVLVCPSPYESLSIVLLEGFARNTPALVNERSLVLKDHCVRSNAGLYYATEDEFVEALDLLVQRPELGRALGENGREYVAREYTWEVVLGRYRALIDAVAGR